MQLFFQEATSPCYWHLNCPSTFLAYSWLKEEMCRRYNEMFFYLTAQNLRTLNDVLIGMIMFRLGQHEEWVQMGMLTVICDAMGKIMKIAGKQGPAVNAAKRPSAGLDFIREILDILVTSYQHYLPGWVPRQDAQALDQIRKTSEAGLQTGFVQFVNGEVQRMPTHELATNACMSEVSWSFSVLRLLLIIIVNLNRPISYSRFKTMRVRGDSVGDTYLAL